MNENDLPLSAHRILITEDDDLDLDALLAKDTCARIQDSPSTIVMTRSAPGCCSTSPPAVELEAGGSEWVLPTPAVPGNHLIHSLHKVPSKSILKKTSSYRNFDCNESISSSQGVVRRRSCIWVNDNDSIDDLSSSTQKANASQSMMRPVTPSSPRSSVGLDLDASNQSLMSTTERNNVVKMERSPSYTASDSSNSSLPENTLGDKRDIFFSDTTTMKRSVSFNSVAVREYDLTIGDNPACRFGPPISLDWSYSKKCEKNVNEYEVERFSKRVNSLNQLYMSKYKRRNVLAHHWGHSEEEMKLARCTTKKVQRQRSVTKLLLPLSFAQEMCYSFKKCVSRKSQVTSMTTALSDTDIMELSLSSSRHLDCIQSMQVHDGEL